MACSPRLILIVLALVLVPQGILADTSEEDDKADRRSERPYVVLDIDKDLNTQDAIQIRTLLESTDGISRFHVCASTRSILIEYEANANRCARSLMKDLGEAGYATTLRNRGTIASSL